MKILYRYLFKEIIITTLAAVGVLTFLMVLANFRKDLFDVLLNNDVPLWTVIKMVSLLIPFVLPFTLPWGLVLAVLIVFGRLSQDRELIAIKSTGVGLAFVVAPVIWLALACSGVCFWINAWLAPECREAFKTTFYDLVSSNPMAFFTPGKPIDKFSGYRIYVGKKDGVHVEDIYLWQVDDKFVPVRSLRADRGEINVDFRNQRLLLTLFNARQEERDSKKPTDVSRIRVGGRAAQFPIDIPLASVLEKFSKKKSLGTLTLNNLYNAVSNPNDPPETGTVIPVLTEIQKRVAFSLSCFTFVLVGIPLGIQTQRRETSVGVVLSLGIVIAYYFLVVLAEALKKNPNVYPEIIIWSPNIIFQALGFFLLYRVNRK